MKKILSGTVLFLILSCFAFAQEGIPPLFDGSWTESEVKNLENGQIVIRNIKKMKNVTITRGINEHVDAILDSFTEMDPCYLAEIIYKMPKEGNENVISQAVEIFKDVDLYKEIIYKDERKDKACPLFPVVELRDTKTEPQKITIATHLKMDMLSEYDSELVINYNENGFYFEQRNKTPLKWMDTITAVKTEKMIAGITCFEYKNEYYVYALGGIKAPRIPLVIYEIDRQFIGRIKDFTVFYIGRFEIAR